MIIYALKGLFIKTFSWPFNLCFIFPGSSFYFMALFFVEWVLINRYRISKNYGILRSNPKLGTSYSTKCLTIHVLFLISLGLI